MLSARKFFLLVFAALVWLRVSAESTPATVSQTSAPAAFTREQLLTGLSHDLSAHFNLEGDLQLELLRAWTPPTQLGSGWDLNVLEYPTAASSSMLVRCRVLADATSVAEVTVVLRASLWRDVWVARQPLPLGSGFDPSTLEARRIDVFRERDVLPATPETARL